MGLPKGRTNNPKGKPKGAKGKKTEQWEQLAETLTGEQSDEFAKFMGELWSGGKDDKLKAADLYIKMVEYFKPKQSRVDTNVSLVDNTTEFIMPEGYED